MNFSNSTNFSKIKKVFLCLLCLINFASFGQNLLDWSTYLTNNSGDKLVNSLEENGFTYNILYNQSAKTVKVIKLNPDGGIVYVNTLSGVSIQWDAVQASVENGEIALGMFVYGSTLPVLNGRNFTGRLDSYITKIDATGQMVFGTHIGGPGVTLSDGNTILAGSDPGNGNFSKNQGLVLKGGKVFIAGYTNSVDLQPTANAAQSVKTPNEYMSWIGVIGSTGSLDYLSYYGDNNGSINGLKADAQNFYIVGNTGLNSIIPLVNQVAGVGDQYGFIAKFNHAGTILGSTKLPSQTTGGGYYGSLENSMQIVNSKIYFSGTTITPITTTPNALDNTFALSPNVLLSGNRNGVIGVLDANFQLEYLSYTSDFENIKVGPDGSIYKITRNPVTEYPNNEHRVEKISPTYGFSSTPYQKTDRGFLEVQEDKVVWTTKTSTSGLFTTPNAAEPVYQGTGDKLYISILNASDLSPVTKTYLGGSVDVSNNTTSGAPLRISVSTVVENGNTYLLIEAVKLLNDHPFALKYVSGFTYLLTFDATGKLDFKSLISSNLAYNTHLGVNNGEVYVSGNSSGIVALTSTIFSGSGDRSFVMRFNPIEPEQNTIPAGQTVCKNSTPVKILEGSLVAVVSEDVPSLTSNGVAFTYNPPVETLIQWQYSTDNVNWIDIPGANASTYLPQASSVTTYYRRSVAGFPSNVHTMTVNSFDTPLVNAGGPFLICTGGSIALNPVVTDGVPPYTYAWTPTQGLSATNIINPVATPPGGGIYTIIVTDANGCVKKEQVNIKEIVANAGSDKTICVGNTTNLGTTPIAGKPPVTYKWTVVSGDANSLTLANSILAQPTVTPNVTTTYEMTINGPGGCPKSDQATITVNQLPTPAPDVSICYGQKVSLGNASLAGKTYQWLPNYGLTKYNATPTIYDGVSYDENIDKCLVKNYVLSISDGICPNFYDTIAVNIVKAYAGENRCGRGFIGTPDLSCGKHTFNWTVLSGDAASLLNADKNKPQPYVNPSSPTVYELAVSFGGVVCRDTIFITQCAGQGGCAPSVSIFKVPIDCKTKKQVTNFTVDISKIAPIYKLKLVGGDFSKIDTSQLPTIKLIAPVVGTLNYQVSVFLLDGSPVVPNCGVSISFQETVYRPIPIDIKPGIICSTSDSLKIGFINPALNYSYEWTPNNGIGLGQDLKSNPNAKPNITTNYLFKVKDNLTGCTRDTSVTVTVRNIVIDAGKDGSFCEGAVFKLGTPGDTLLNNYAWTPAIGLDNAKIPQPTITLYTPTDFYLTVTDKVTGCFKKDTVAFIENPRFKADAGSDYEVCFGKNIRLGTTDSSAFGFRYRWLPKVGLSSDTVARPFLTVKSTQLYTLIMEKIGAFGCESSDVVEVKLKTPPPVIVQTLPAISICGVGGSVTIGLTSAPANSKFSWNPNTYLTDSTKAQTLAKPPINTTYKLTVSDTVTCQVTTYTQIVNVVTKKAYAGTDIKICGSGTAKIGLESVVGNTYVWTNLDGSPATTLSANNIAQPIANPTATSSYVVTVNAGTCVFKDTVQVQINPKPIANAGIDKSVCTTGQTIGVAPVAGNTYAWTPALGLSSDAIANPTANPSQTTKYVLVVKNTASGCTNSDTVIVTQQTQITATSVTYEVCPGGTVTIGPSSQAGYTYAYSPATDLSATNIANPISTPTANRTYTLAISNGACSRNVTYKVNVLTKPTLNIGTDPSVCQGSCIFINATTNGTINNYQWSPITGVSQPNQASTQICPTQSGQYILSGISDKGCVVKDTIDIAVAQTAAPVANAGKDTTICFGSTYQMGMVPNANYSYEWSPFLNLNNGFIANPNGVMVSPSTTYTVKVIDNLSGCVSYDQVVIKVQKIDVTVPSQSICLGEKVMLNPAITALPTVLDSQLSYVWSPSTGLNNTTLKRPTLSPSITGTYNLKVKHIPTGCEVLASSLITVDPSLRPTVNLPQQVNLCSGTGYQVAITPVVGYTYKWTTTYDDYDQDGNQITVEVPVSSLPNPLLPVGAIYNLQITNTLQPGNCSKNTQSISVYADSPIVTPSALPEVIICKGSVDSVLLGNRLPYNVNYQWIPSTGLDNPTIRTPKALPNSTQIYTVALSQPVQAGVEYIGCVATSTSQKVVRDAVALVDAGADKSICVGQSVRIGTSSAIVGSTYTWSPKTNITDTISTNPYVNPLTTTTYTILVKDKNGCLGTDQVTVTVGNPNAGLDLTACLQVDSVVLKLPANGETYVALAGNPSSTTYIRPNIIKGYSVAGTYKFALVNTSGGCSDTVSVVVKSCCSITALPVIVNPCNDNLTKNTATDDYFSVKITAILQFGGKYEIVQGAVNGVGGTVLNMGGTTSGTAVTTGKFKADGITFYSLIIRDLQSPTCFIELPTIAPVASCSVSECPSNVICLPLGAKRN